MPTIQLGPTAVAAGATNDNILTGSQFEFLPNNARLEIGVNGSAAGLLVDAYAGGDIITESFAVNAQNRIPLYPDDISMVENIAGGTRMKVRVRNPTGGSLNFFALVRLTYL